MSIYWWLVVTIIIVVYLLVSRIARPLAYRYFYSLFDRGDSFWVHLAAWFWFPAIVFLGVYTAELIFLRFILHLFTPKPANVPPHLEESAKNAEQLGQATKSFFKKISI